jgi:hypothetical protein
MGALLRLKMPPTPYIGEFEEHPDVARSLSIMAGNLATTEIVTEGELDGLVASPDGSRVFYRIAAEDGEGGQDWMLITKGGAPQRIGGEKRE